MKISKKSYVPITLRIPESLATVVKNYRIDCICKMREDISLNDIYVKILEIGFDNLKDNYKCHFETSNKSEDD